MFGSCWQKTQMQNSSLTYDRSFIISLLQILTNLQFRMDQLFKIMLMGDVSTGKTSFMTQLIYQNPQKMPKSTNQLISNPATVIQIWDTPGDPRYYFKAISILQSFRSVLIFIDMTSQHTFNRARQMIEQLKVYPKITMHLILSKLDIIEKMPYKRKVNSEGVQLLAKSIGGLILQYSQNEKIQEILEKVVIHFKDLNKKIRKEDKKIFNNPRNKVQTAQQQNQSCQCEII